MQGQGQIFGADRDQAQAGEALAGFNGDVGQGGNLRCFGQRKVAAQLSGSLKLWRRIDYTGLCRAAVERVVNDPELSGGSHPVGVLNHKVHARGFT